MNNSEFTDKNPKFFYDPKEFSFLKVITRNFQVIREELLQLIDANKEEQWLGTFPDYVKAGKKKSWKVFSFIFFNMKFPENAKRCPRTAELIYSIPEIMSCDYSYMEPHTHVTPHKGYSRMVLRCHLPLLVPKGDLCGIRVGTETVHWKEGELIVFDDSFEHEAWNRSDARRVVLMFDIPNPLWGYSAAEISAYKIKNMEDPFLLSMASKEEWWQAFERGEFPLTSFGR